MLVALIVLMALPSVVPGYDLYLAEDIMGVGLLAISLDLVYGYAGLPSLGQAAYFGVGGYCVALLSLKAGVSSGWVLLAAGIVAGGLAAAAFGLVALRTRGFHYLLTTFALGQLLAALGTYWGLLQVFGTGGLVGISMPDIGFGTTWWGTTSTYYGIFIVFAVAYFLVKLLARSPLAYAAIGLRESEPRMKALGYNTWWCKYKIMIVAGAVAALGGEIFAFSSGAIFPSNVDISYSGLAFLMVVLGGAGTIDGPLLGAVVIVLLQHYVSDASPARWPLILGIVFVLSALFVRRGILREGARLMRTSVRRVGKVVPWMS